MHLEGQLKCVALNLAELPGRATAHKVALYRRVVQLANTLACHARDHGFEPRHGDHNSQ